MNKKLVFFILDWDFVYILLLIVYRLMKEKIVVLCNSINKEGVI